MKKEFIARLGRSDPHASMATPPSRPASVVLTQGSALGTQPGTNKTVDTTKRLVVATKPVAVAAKAEILKPGPRYVDYNSPTFRGFSASPDGGYTILYAPKGSRRRRRGRHR